MRKRNEPRDEQLQTQNAVGAPPGGGVGSTVAQQARNAEAGSTAAERQAKLASPPGPAFVEMHPKTSAAWHMIVV